jgi:hypothetical protein
MPDTFENVLASARRALQVLGTGALRSADIRREGARAYGAPPRSSAQSPSTGRPTTETVVGQSERDA